MARVLIIDDSDEIRLLVRLLLDTDPSLDVVGEAMNGAEGVAQADALAPDLIVMDVAMPVMDGIEATRRIKEPAPGTEVVAFSSATERSTIEAILTAGACTKVDKSELDHLLAVLHDLAEATRRETVSGGRFAETMASFRRATMPVFGMAAVLTLALFAVSLRPGGVQDVPTGPRDVAASVPNDPVASVDTRDGRSETVDDEGNQERKRGRATRGSSTPASPVALASSSDPASSSAPGTSPSDGSGSAGSGSAGSGPGSGAVAADMPANDNAEVPALAIANYESRPGADKAAGAKARRTS